MLTMPQVHPTGSNPNSQSTSKTHALNDGEDSIVPKKVQEIVPESVERGKSSTCNNDAILTHMKLFPTRSTTPETSNRVLLPT